MTSSHPDNLNGGAYEMFHAYTYSYENRARSQGVVPAILGLLAITGYGLFALGHYTNREESSPHRPRVRGVVDLININTAGHKEFRERFGLERAMVERIIANRPYISKIDLIERRILPDDTYEAIKFDITVHDVA